MSRTISYAKSHENRSDAASNTLACSVPGCRVGRTGTIMAHTTSEYGEIHKFKPLNLTKPSNFRMPSKICSMISVLLFSFAVQSATTSIKNPCWYNGYQGWCVSVDENGHNEDCTNAFGIFVTESCETGVCLSFTWHLLNLQYQCCIIVECNSECCGKGGCLIPDMYCGEWQTYHRCKEWPGTYAMISLE
jgi:hypothetical protein